MRAVVRPVAVRAEDHDVAVEAAFAQGECGVVAGAPATDDDHSTGRHQSSVDTRGLYSQLWVSGAAPRWMSTRAWRSRMLTSPGAPSPTDHDPRADFTAPTGVTTAAVPHAKTSVSDPSSQPWRHSSTLILPSSV